MKTMCRFIWLVAILASLGPAIRSAGQTPANISLVLTATQDTVQVGAPVNVSIVTKNISNQDVDLWVVDARQREGRVYGAEVRDEQGNLAADTRFARILKYHLPGSKNDPPELLTGVGADVSLNPGQTFFDHLDVGKLYDFSHPGKYTVRVQRFDDSSKTWVKSNTITITVAPSQNAPQSLALSSEPPFSLTIGAIPGDSVRRGSAIGLKVVTTNLSNHTILLWGDKAENLQGQTTYGISIHAADGSSAPDTPLGRAQKARTDAPRGPGYSMVSPPSGEKLALRPGETWTDTVVLNGLYDLSKPGTYTVQASRFDPATETMVKSNALTLTILP